MTLDSARAVLLNQLTPDCWTALAIYRGYPNPPTDEYEKRLFLDTILSEHVRADELMRRLRERMGLK